MTKYIYHFILVLLLVASCGRANEIAREGISKLEEGKNVTALTLFENALSIDSENALALYGKGRLLIQQEITRHMGKLMLEKAGYLLSDPQQRKNSFFLLATFGEPTESIKILKTMIQKKMGDSEVYSKLAVNQIRIKKIKDALATYLEAIKKYPKESHLMVELAYFYADRMNDYSKSYKYYKASGEEDIDSDCLIGFAKVSYLIGKKDEAIKIIQRILGKEIIEEKANELEKIKIDILKNRWRPTF